MRGRLAPYEYPREIEFIDALPMTTTGKVQRKELRKREEAKLKLAEGVKRVLLIGAGHGHLVVLRSLAEKPLYGARITLVTPYAQQVYSGMLPGLLAGHYRRADTQIDVAALAERAYVEFAQGEVERLDAEAPAGDPARTAAASATTPRRSTPGR